MNEKFFTALIAIAAISFKPLVSIYSIDVQTLDGSIVNLGSFAGKKIIIIEFDAANYDKEQLGTLDSIQQVNKGAVVIGVPAQDFGNTMDVQSIQKKLSDQKLSFIVTQPVFVSRSAGKNQHPLFKWLTDVNENTHFNYDADQPGQTFMVSETGDLYAILYKEAANATVTEAATQKTN